MVTVVTRTDAEEVSDDGVDGDSLLEGPSDGGSIINARGGITPGQCLTNCGGNRLLKEKSRQLNIQVGDGSLRSFEVD